MRSSFGEQAVIFRCRHTWITCWLYLGTFGTFIGLAAALPLLLASHFPQSAAAQLAWLGPLVGAVLRPLGGWLSDRYGGARVTLACLATMLAGTALLLPGLSLPELSTSPAAETPVAEGAQGAGAHLAVVAGGVFALFAAAGIGSSSVFKMIPLIFGRLHGSGDAEDNAASRAHAEAGATLGLCSAIGAYGGFVIPKSFGTSLAFTGSAAPALAMFFAFYLSCIALTWWHYGRPGAAMPC